MCLPSLKDLLLALRKRINTGLLRNLWKVVGDVWAKSVVGRDSWGGKGLWLGLLKSQFC